jgi:hypothetical protein
VFRTHSAAIDLAKRPAKGGSASFMTHDLPESRQRYNHLPLATPFRMRAERRNTLAGLHHHRQH